MIVDPASEPKISETQELEELEEFEQPTVGIFEFLDFFVSGIRKNPGIRIGQGLIVGSRSDRVRTQDFCGRRPAILAQNPTFPKPRN